jgi:hypothetical protein
MAAGKYNFTIEQGATLDFEVQYKDSCNNPIDLTGYSGRMQFRSNFADNTGSIYLTLSSSRDADGTGLNFSGSTGIKPPTSGSIGIFASSTVTQALVLSQSACTTGGRILYDLELYSGSTPPYTIRLIEGSVNVSKEVTRF